MSVAQFKRLSNPRPLKQSEALRPSRPFEATVGQKLSHRCYLLLPWCFRDAGSWCSESHWRQICCMTESLETSAAWRTSRTSAHAFTGSSFTARRYAALSLLHIRYALIYKHTHRNGDLYLLDGIIKTVLKLFLKGENQRNGRKITLFSVDLDSKIRASNSLAWKRTDQTEAFV